MIWNQIVRRILRKFIFTKAGINGLRPNAMATPSLRIFIWISSKSYTAPPPLFGVSSMHMSINGSELFWIDPFLYFKLFYLISGNILVEAPEFCMPPPSYLYTWLSLWHITSPPGLWIDLYLGSQKNNRSSFFQMMHTLKLIYRRILFETSSPVAWNI